MNKPPVFLFQGDGQLPRCGHTRQHKFACIRPIYESSSSLYASPTEAIASEGLAVCQIARALGTSGVKTQIGNGIVSPFSVSYSYNVLGYVLGSTNCNYDISKPLYQPDWCKGWQGLACDNNNLVTYMSVYGYSWTQGSHIPTAIGALTNLRELRLYNMGLTGTIPNAGLTRLTALYIDSNRLTGSVPAFVNTMYTANRINYLNLQNNCNLTSSVPELSNLLSNNQGNCGPKSPGRLFL